MPDNKLSLLLEIIFKKQEQGIAGDYVCSTVCWWLVQTRASAARWEDKVGELLQTQQLSFPKNSHVLPHVKMKIKIKWANCCKPNNYLFCEEKGMREAGVERG